MYWLFLIWYCLVTKVFFPEDHFDFRSADALSSPGFFRDNLIVLHFYYSWKQRRKQTSICIIFPILSDYPISRSFMSYSWLQPYYLDALHITMRNSKSLLFFWKLFLDLRMLHASQITPIKSIFLKILFTHSANKYLIIWEIQE